MAESAVRPQSRSRVCPMRDLPMKPSPSDFPSRRRCGDGAAALRRAARRARCAPPRPAEFPRRMVCINTPLGLHPAFFFPEKAGPRLRAVAVPGGLEGLSRRLHGDLRAVASRHRPQPRFQPELSDRGPASGTAGGVQEQRLARPVRGRSDLRPDAFRHAHAVLRGCRPFLDQERCARADGGLAVAACSPSCSWKAAPKR